MGIIQSKYIFSPECDKCIKSKCGQCLKKDDVAKKKNDAKQKSMQKSKPKPNANANANATGQTPLIKGGRRKRKKSKKRSKKYLK